MAAALSAAGYHLLCPVRPAASPDTLALLEALPGVELLHTQIDDPTRVFRDLGERRSDYLISCIASRGGGRRDSWRVEYDANQHLLKWALDAEVQHFTLLSAICVQKPRLEFQRAKARFERELMDSGISYSIVRPTAFFKSLCGQVERIQSGKAFLLFGNGALTACKPIGERDLAAFLLRTLTEPDLQNAVLPIGGPGPAITPLEQGRLLAALAGRPLRTRSLPPVLFKVAARLLDGLGSVVPGLADKAEFARIAHYYATESMLLWDSEGQRYDPRGTPEFGSETLEDCYRRLLAGEANTTQRLGSHALFSRREP